MEFFKVRMGLAGERKKSVSKNRCGCLLAFLKHENFYLQGRTNFFKWIKDYYNEMAAAAAVCG